MTTGTLTSVFFVPTTGFLTTSVSVCVPTTGVLTVSVFVVTVGRCSVSFVVETSTSDGRFDDDVAVVGPAAGADHRERAGYEQHLFCA